MRLVGGEAGELPHYYIVVSPVLGADMTFLKGKSFSPALPKRFYIIVFLGNTPGNMW